MIKVLIHIIYYKFTKLGKEVNSSYSWGNQLIIALVNTLGYTVDTEARVPHGYTFPHFLIQRPRCDKKLKSHNYLELT